MGARLSSLHVDYALALAGGVLAASLVTRRPGLAAVTLVAGALLLAVFLLADRAFASFVAVGAALPFFEMHEGFEGEGVLRIELVAATMLLLVLVPFAWSLAFRRSERPLRRAEVPVIALIVFVLAVMVVEQRSKALSGLSSGGFAVGLVTYLCAKRSPRPADWPAAATVALALLIVLGALEFSAAPSERIGTFTGYPIEYSVLLVCLLPPALVWAYSRSKAIAALLGLGGLVAIILSQTRSAWVACIVVIVVALVFLARMGKGGAIALVLGGTLALAGVIATSGDLSEVIETRLARESLTTSSLTHREFSYGYTWERFLDQPLLGEHYPGALKADISRLTGISAADNGYLSLAGDLGIVGLALALLPAAVALGTLGRLWRRAEPAPAELGLALGLLGGLVVTIFFDTFYWPQSSAVVFGMAGVLAASRHLRAGSNIRPAAA